MNRLTDYLIVISFDCLSALDFPLLQTLPHFQKILQHGAIAQKVETIYPSITYPCHATIVTGNYPKRHGVINNTLFQPGRLSPDWHWYRESIRGTTLYDEVKKANMTTATLLWPVTGKADIDYNMPEIWANRPWKNQILTSLLSGSALFQWDLNKRFGHIRQGLNQPQLDDFVLASTVYTIKSKQPNLLMVHFTDLDTQRHYHGFSSSDAIGAIYRHNDRLGEILQALIDSGLEGRSTVIILGDHSALNENQALHLNVLLYQHGLISINSNGRLNNWKAYCKSCDGSAYIYIKDKHDSETLTAVLQLLDSLLEDPESGIERVLTGEQAGEKGADPSCAFMIEAREGYYFLEDYQGEYRKTVTPEDVTADKKYTLATHGYSPEKEGYSTILMAAGKGIRPGSVPSIHLVDEGPTFARLLGVDLGPTDGRVVEEMLDIH